MLDKCNFTAHVWCEHNVTITKKKLQWKKRSQKCFVTWMSFQYCSCSHFLLRILWNKCLISQKSKDALLLLPGVQQVGKICGLQQRQNKVQRSNAWCCHSYRPSREARGAPQNFPWTSTGYPWSHWVRFAFYWNILAGHKKLFFASQVVLAAQTWPTFAL